MTWSELDWRTLDRLRDRFLHGTAGGGSYWEKPEDLANYDFTYGERIGWKWDHVLRELRIREWRPASRHVVDWGCGSGIASRRVIEFFGADQFETLTVWDQSPLACDFAAGAAQRAFPGLRMAQATPGFLASTEPIGLLVVSHVLNELPVPARQSLLELAQRAEIILWVEPGTHAVSRQLGEVREQLRAAGFGVVAPCTHALPCPMFAPENQRHWCHFFAPPPPDLYADSNWVTFGQRAGIDLRSLPYCFIALERVVRSHNATGATGLSRVIGRPEHFKPYARLLNCDATGLAELELPKRSDPALFKELDRTKHPLVYRWERDGTKILGGEAVGKPAEESSAGL
jgi:SAM-dependent methyltransferase